MLEDSSEKSSVKTLKYFPSSSLGKLGFGFFGALSEVVASVNRNVLFYKL